MEILHLRYLIKSGVPKREEGYENFRLSCGYLKYYYHNSDVAINITQCARNLEVRRNLRYNI